MRQWKEAHRDRLAPRRRALYAAQTADEKRDRNQLEWERHPYKMRAKVMYAGMWNRARVGIPHDKDAFNVTTLTDWLMRSPNCECCGQTLQLVPIAGVPSNASPSVDRIVPSLGYVLGNVALLCWRCNNLKRDATAEELRRIADWLDAR